MKKIFISQPVQGLSEEEIKRGEKKLLGQSQKSMAKIQRF